MENQLDTTKDLSIILFEKFISNFTYNEIESFKNIYPKDLKDAYYNIIRKFIYKSLNANEVFFIKENEKVTCEKILEKMSFK